VAGEHADGGAAVAVPHAHILVTAREHIGAIGVEAADVHIAVMPDKHAERCNVLGAPQPRHFVVAAGKEVVSVRTPPHIPYWRIVATVGDQTSPDVTGPEADGFVGGSREQVAGASRWRVREWFGG
jgi:hypothetical protein